MYALVTIINYIYIYIPLWPALVYCIVGTVHVYTCKYDAKMDSVSG